MKRLVWTERLHYHKPRPGQTSSRQSGKGNSRLQSQHTHQVVLSECTQRIPREAGCVHLQRKEQSSFLSDQSPQGSDLGAETQFYPSKLTEGMRVPTEHGSIGQRPLGILPRFSGKEIHLSEKRAAKMALCHWSYQGRWDREQRVNSSNVLTRQRSCQPCIILQALPGNVDVHSGFKDRFPIVDGLHGGNFISLLL